MVRCPFAHAVIKNIDTQIAKAKTGVLGIFTGEDCEADGLGQIPHSPFPSTKFDMKLHGPGGTVGDNSFAGINTVLPTDKGRYVGEAIAMVVAETKMQAAEAAEFLEIDYEILPSVTNTRAAAGESASKLYSEIPDNVFVETFFGRIERHRSHRHFFAGATPRTAEIPAEVAPAANFPRS